MPLRKVDPRKYCRFCGLRLRRKVMNGRLEDLSVFVRRKYCDQLCMAQDMVKPNVAKATYHMRARKHRKPACERCGSTIKLEVHHKDLDWKNNDPSNLETICGCCHGRHHGPKRGELFASRMRIDKQVIRDVAAALHDILTDGGTPLCNPERITDLLHRSGFL